MSDVVLVIAVVGIVAVVAIVFGRPFKSKCGPVELSTPGEKQGSSEDDK